MKLFSHPSFDAHEGVLFVADQNSGLRSIIAIHNTSRGPALGGCRMWAYEDEGHALTDALRLARGMTYKAAMADLPLGGGKTVILGDAKTEKSAPMFRALGRAIDGFGGRYILAEDVGTSPSDMLEVRRATRHVAGIAPEHGGWGDPSPATAYGVYVGLVATVRHALKRESVAGLTVAVQGLGNVGFGLCRHLHQAGAKLIVTDLDRARVDRATAEFSAQVVALDEIVAVEADVFSPNALGAVLNERTIPLLRVAAVAGGANNQLADSHRDGQALARREITYAPDYVVNAGGLTNACGEYFGWEKGEVDRRIEGIATRLRAIFEEAAAKGAPTPAVADQQAERLFRRRALAA